MKKYWYYWLFAYRPTQTKYAAEVSHYTEFAREYGIIRYFSPNPYTRNWSESDWMKVCALLIDRAKTQPIETVFEPLAPTSFISDTPTSAQESVAGKNKAARYYYYSGAGNLNISLVARLLTPGLTYYIPYYKKLYAVSNNPDSVAPPVAYRYYAYQVAAGKYLNIQHALPQKAFDGKAILEQSSVCR